jgi:hypothetical protein
MAKKPRVKWYGKQVEKAALDAAMKALITGGEAILTEAINETPVDTGTLRRSGTVTKGGLPDAGKVYEGAKAGGRQELGQEKGKEQAVYVSFNTPYARRQHEELEWEHLKGGKAKYLEDPFNRLKSKVRKLVDASVKKALQQKR